MTESSVYLTLPSNASMARYPKNTGGSYTVQLPQTLHLNSSWEVGLSEIIFNQDWSTVNVGDIWARVDTYKLNVEEEQISTSDRNWKGNIWGRQIATYNFDEFHYTVENDHARYMKDWLKRDEPLTMVKFIEKWTAQEHEMRKKNKVSLESAASFKNGKFKLDLHLLLGSNDKLKKFAEAINADAITKAWPYDEFKMDPNREYNLGIPQYIEEIYHNETDKLIEKTIVPLIKKAFIAAGAETSTLIVALVKKTHTNGLHHTVLKIQTKGVLLWRLELSTSLLQILGYTRSQLSEQRFFKPTPNIYTSEPTILASIDSEYNRDMSRAQSSLWVYSDLIKAHVVGHTTASLLRIIGIDKGSTSGNTRVISFTHPHYYPLAQHDISDIRVSIYNIFGEKPINFRTPVICQLHFRRRLEPLNNESELPIKRMKLDETM